MNKAKIISIVATVSLMLMVASRAEAQLTEFKWNNPALIGSQNWQVDGNWDMMGWPDDPGRSGAGRHDYRSLGGRKHIGGANRELDTRRWRHQRDGGVRWRWAARLGAVTTTISEHRRETGLRKLRGQQHDPRPGRLRRSIAARRWLPAAGVAGSTNIISAPIQINGERLVFDSASTNNLTISGPVTFANLATAPGIASARFAA